MGHGNDWRFIRSPEFWITTIIATIIDVILSIAKDLTFPIIPWIGKIIVFLAFWLFTILFSVVVVWFASFVMRTLECDVYNPIKIIAVVLICGIVAIVTVRLYFPALSLLPDSWKAPRPGAIAYNDGYVYFRDTQKGGALYRAAADGSGDVKQLNEQNSYDINLLKYGDAVWVYYVNEDNKNRIYRVNAENPTSPEIVGNNSDGDYAAYLNVFDNVVYYCDNRKGSQYLNAQVLGHDGNHTRHTLTDELKHKVFAMEAADDGWVYYNTGLIDNCREFRIRMNNPNEAERLSSDSWAYVNVVDGWIYYCNKSKDFNLFKLPVEGPWPTETPGDQLNADSEGVSHVVATDDYVVYLSLYDKNLYRLDIESGNSTLILDADDEVEDLVADGDWIYFIGKDHKPYRIGKDGNDKIPLVKE